MTDFEEAVMDYWHAAFIARLGLARTAAQRFDAAEILLDLTETAPTDGLRDRAREACLTLGIVKPGFRCIPGGAA